MVAGQIAELGFAIQTAKGTPAPAAVWRVRMAGGTQPEPDQISGLTSTLSTTRIAREGYIEAVRVAGAPEMFVRPRFLGLLLYAVLGGETASGAADPFLHVFTLANSPPWFTVWRSLGGVLFERFTDCRLASLELVSQAGRPMLVRIGILGISGAHKTTAEVGGTLDTADLFMHYHAKGALLVDGSPVSSINEWTLRIDGAAEVSPSLAGEHVRAGARLSIGVTASQTVQNADLWRRAMYGSTSPANNTAAGITPLYLALDFKVTEQTSPERSLRLELPRVVVVPGSLQPDVRGGALRVTNAFQAVRPTSGSPLTATLRNSVGGTYASPVGDTALAGSSAGSSSAAATLSAPAGLSGTAIAGSGATASLLVPVRLVGSSAGTSSAAGDLSQIVGFYGSAVAMDGLGNIQVGGSANAPANLMSAYRFRAKSSAIDAVRIQIPNSGVGYSGGDGGKIEVSIRTDDGTANHFPTATVLGTPVVLSPGIGVPPPGTGNYPLVTFPSPIAVTPGTLYHVHFRNTAAAPTVDFTSIDMIVNESLPLPTPKQGPRWAETDWAINVSAGSWEGPLKYGVGQSGDAVYTPIMAIFYNDGSVEGIGYNFSELSSGKKNIGGNAKVRQTITLGADRKVASAHIRVRRVSGSGDLTIRLEQSDGTLVEAGTVANASVPTAANIHWVGITFATPRVLAAASSYNLVLSAPAGTIFETFGMEDGSGRGFPPETYFGDGKGQYTTDGSTWLDLLAGSRTDLQFYFVVVP